MKEIVLTGASGFVGSAILKGSAAYLLKTMLWQ